MALVPSGRFVLQETQHIKCAQLSPATPQERDTVEQQQIGQGGQQATPAAQPTPAVPAAPEQQSPDMTQSPEKGEQMATPNDAGAVNTPVDKSESAVSDKASSMQTHIYKVLEELGVQRRQIDSLSKNLFGQEIDLDTKTISGHYMIPTFTTKGEIDESRAQQIAQAIGQRFGMSQKMRLEGGKNWRVDFKSQVRDDKMQGGSSFDSMHENSQKKAASTLGEMIKDRREELYTVMRKIAKQKVQHVE